MATKTSRDSGACPVVEGQMPIHSHASIDICCSCKREPCVLDLDSVPAVQKACRFLTEFLSDGPQVATAVEEAAAQRGISKRTLVRAKAELEIVSRREWLWHPKSAK